MKDSEIGHRLKLIALAMGFNQIKTFAEFLGIEQNQLSKYLRGVRRLTVEPAILIAERTTYTIDFLYANDRRGLTDDQKRRLAEVEARFPELNKDWARRGRSTRPRGAPKS